MGRKKIEIKPLTDERNRNVTFLKRKAGLMKKAYELSVLCGVTVSLLIFSHNGKPYEFSSGDFDAEVDRYNDYEGTIERRRGAEFEAMAKAGEDDDDDEDEDDGKGKPKPNGPAKSLKGKESFKARRSRRGEDRRDRDRGRDKPPVDETFVGALMNDVNGSGHASPRRGSDSAGLQYALGLHTQSNPPGPSQQPPPSAPGGMPWNAYRQGAGGLQFGPYGSQSNGPPFLPTPGMASPMGNVQSMPAGNPPWDQSMLTTYAWLQIQQAHQEQKRHLLEKQQQQLLELTSRSGGAALFRDILGTGGNSNNPAASSAANISAALNEFVWPTAPPEEPQVSTPPDDDLVWALSGAGGPPQNMQGPSNHQQYEYAMTMDGKRRDARDMSREMFAAAKRRKQ